MRRFTAAVVTNAVNRTLLITSPTFLGLCTGARVSVDRSTTAAVGVRNFSTGSTPQRSTPDVKALQRRVAGLDTELTASMRDLNKVVCEIADLAERNHRLRDAVSRQLSKEERAELAARLAELEQANAVEKNLAIVARALQIVDDD